jgi:preprotein translocase subunit SecG
LLDDIFESLIALLLLSDAKSIGLGLYYDASDFSSSSSSGLSDITDFLISFFVL